MGYFRFRRSFRILPGMRINLGKKLASVSLGVRGAHVTLGGPQGTRTTVGIPGTGLSYTETAGHHHAAQTQPEAAQEPVSQGSAARGFLWLALIAVLLIYGVAKLAGAL